MAPQAQPAHANGNGLSWTSWPKWQQALFVIGPTAAIALYLVFRVDGRLFTVVERVEARIEVHAAAAAMSDAEQAKAADAIVKASEAERAQVRSLIGLIRQVCLNTARNDEARDKCVQ